MFTRSLADTRVPSVVTSSLDATPTVNRQGTPGRLRVGMVGTYPPTECGIATFTAGLRDALREARPRWDFPVARVVEPPAPHRRREVGASWVRGQSWTLGATLRELNDGDAAVIQHEFGIFDGPDGDSVLDLLAGLTVPTVVVLHTVLSAPSDGQRRVIDGITRRADAVVVPSATALARLRRNHHAGHAVVIPHGADANIDESPEWRRPGRTILTWGLLGPGKGLEEAFGALSALRDLQPTPRYVVAGHTHPHERGRHDDYRDHLRRVAREVGVADLVEFDDHYRSRSSLNNLIRRADVVLLPYLSTEQVCSGVLVEALASARPVVATAFPHAVELLEGGAGIVVPHGDGTAMADALRSVLTDDQLAADMTRHAWDVGESLLWPQVARRYAALIKTLVEKGR